MATKLKLALLGSPQFWLDDKPITTFRTAKAQALLAYLAVTGLPHLRSSLVGLLWGEMPETNARKNLTKTLSELRRITSAHIVIDGQTVAFRRSAPYALDVEAVRTAAQSVAHEPDEAQLSAAAALIRGDFLEGFGVRNAPDFEFWMLAQRTQLREQAVQLIDGLTHHFHAQGNRTRAIASARQLLTLDSWREETHRHLMQLLAEDGQRSAALAQYEACRNVLAEELAIEPSPETEELVAAIRAGATFFVPESAGPPRRNAAAQPQHELPRLPAPATSFVGRQTELADLRKLVTEDGCRLLTLIGPGGIGKTRLALELAASLEAAFADGVCFVPLASIREPSTMVSAIADAVGVTLGGDQEIKAKLVAYLREKELLLVADNVEQLLAGVDLFSALLEAAPGLCIVATSRQRLGLREAWNFYVQGMDYPGSADEAEVAMGDYSAVELFVQRAQQADAAFTAFDGEFPHIARITQLVDGMPLGIELAATWIHALSCAEIAEEIERNYAFLSTSLQNVPERHRSLRAVFEQSWQRLPPEEQAALAGLAVFQGGCTRGAAAVVVDTELDRLATLVEKALLRRSAAGRYDMHPLLLQFAMEKLAARPEADELERRHGQYYLGLLRKQGAELFGPNPKQAVMLLKADLDNIRQGWRWAVEHDQWDAVSASTKALATFQEFAGLYPEASGLFDAAIERVTAFASTTLNADEVDDNLIDRLLSLLYSQRVHFLFLCGNRIEAETAAAMAFQHAEDETDDAVRAEACLARARILEMRGEYMGMLRWIQEALTFIEQSGDSRFQATVLNDLSWAYFLNKMPDKNLMAAQQAMRMSSAVGNLFAEARSAGQTALAYYIREQYETALTYNLKALSLYEEMDNRLYITNVSNNIGLCHLRLGRYKEALVFAERTLHLNRLGGQSSLEADALQLVGEIHVISGHFVEAQRFLGNALHLCRKLDLRKTTRAVHFWLGKLYSEQGDYEIAQTHLERALTLAEESADSRMAAACVGEIGLIHDRRNEHELALEQYDQALESFRQLSRRGDAFPVLLQKSLLLLEQGRIGKARTTLREGQTLAQELQRHSFLFQSRIMEAKLQAAAGEREVALQALQHLLTEANTPDQQAETLYELWKVSDDPAWGERALAALIERYAATPRAIYQKRIDELRTAPA